MSNTISIHPITQKLLNGELNLDDITLDQFREGRVLYSSMKDAKHKGYEAHHIIPRSVQKKRGILEGTADFNDSCLRYTAFEHMVDHYLMSKINPEYSYVFQFMVSLLDSRMTEEEISALDKCKGYAEMREKSVKALIERDKNNKYHLGHKVSEEGRRKMSEAAKKRKREPLSEETKQKIREANINKPRSEETRRKMSGAKKGTTPWNKGKKMPRESVEKQRAKVKGRPVRPEVMEERMKMYAQMKIEFRDLKNKGFSGDWNVYQSLKKQGRLQEEDILKENFNDFNHFRS